MSPDFDDLVGGDIEQGERARLERVHDLLVAAGPPPESVVAAPVQLRPRRRRGALLAIAAALAVASFAVGAAVVDHWGGPNVDFTQTMTGTASATNATGSLVVFDIDAAGNWPMELTVDGLPPRVRRQDLRALADARRQARGALRELPHRRRRVGGRPAQRAVPLRRVRRLGRRRGGLGHAAPDDLSPPGERLSSSS